MCFSCSSEKWVTQKSNNVLSSNFFAKLKKTAIETYQLREVYGEDTLSQARVFEWHIRFLGGKEDVEDDERPGRPVTMKTDENVDKVRTLVRNDRRLSIRMIAEELNVDQVLQSRGTIKGFAAALYTSQAQ
jgi:hypothetical protein